MNRAASTVIVATATKAWINTVTMKSIITKPCVSNGDSLFPHFSGRSASSTIIRLPMMAHILVKGLVPWSLCTNKEGIISIGEKRNEKKRLTTKIKKLIRVNERLWKIH